MITFFVTTDSTKSLFTTIEFDEIVVLSAQSSIIYSLNFYSLHCIIDYFSLFVVGFYHIMNFKIFFLLNLFHNVYSILKAKVKPIEYCGLINPSWHDDIIVTSSHQYIY